MVINALMYKIKQKTEHEKNKCEFCERVDVHRP
jgi:hypothetical protein